MMRTLSKWASTIPTWKTHNSNKTKTTHAWPQKKEKNISKRNLLLISPIPTGKKWSNRTSSSKHKFTNWPNRWTRSWPGRKSPRSMDFMQKNKKIKYSRQKSSNSRSNKAKLCHSRTRFLSSRDSLSMFMTVGEFRERRTSWKICKRNWKLYRMRNKHWWKWKSNRQKR